MTISPLRRTVLCFLSVFMLLAGSSTAQTIHQKAAEFVDVLGQLKQPELTGPEPTKGELRAKTVDKVMSFITDDFSDLHAAYGVTVSGKDKFRENLSNSSRPYFSHSLTIQSISTGTGVAFVDLVEKSEYVRREELVDFKGRTLLVLEFNDEGLITHMRRYLDRSSVDRKAVSCSETDLC